MSLFRLYFISFIILVFSNANIALADSRQSGLGLGFNIMQSIWQGKKDNPKMTKCRLIKRKINAGDQMCVYKGAQNTFVAIYNDKGAFCPNSMLCKLNPDDSKTVGSFVQAFMKK
ncbi:MAG TPA: hypothetical protein DIT62_01405 [Alphaproteobacteria bacterium]|nr:hypothetical protein [Alphaproteobacteria bacterium]|tara:strand:+ start:105 stop:449 length:345 start_codon:yes stop_codon:yes gene_type:complete